MSTANPGQRQRAKSSFSFRSNHSAKSSGSNKIDLHETHDEKESRRLNSKADPSLAIHEAEPSAVAASVKTSLASIRAIQHRDAQGNPIADPDLSNPTRSRWERPLDTIRSFEAAIDGNYSRKPYSRSDSADSSSNHGRRNSYYGGTQVTTDDRSKSYQNSYYGGRPQPQRSESSYMDGRNGYNNGAENGRNGYYPNRARYPRTSSEPHFNNGQAGGYAAAPNQQAYDSATTASGSGSSGEHAGYSTDPSSENTSESYGYDAYGGNPLQGQAEQYGANGAQAQGYGYPNQGQPALSRMESAGPRVPIKLGSSNESAASNVPAPVAAPAAAPAAPPAEEKSRKGWFGKRFSKNS